MESDLALSSGSKPDGTTRMPVLKPVFSFGSSGREVYPDSLSETKAYRGDLTGQQQPISFFSQPLKIKDSRRFVF
jgi:hypothetical protein